MVGSGTARETASAARIGRVETWIFDLDNTLYPPSAGLLDQIDRRMTDFIARVLGVPAIEADRLRARYFSEHGATLEGLMRNHGVAPELFLAEVHAIDLSGVRPDPDLSAAIAALPGRRIVHTNGPRAHAERVLAARALTGLFETVMALEDKDLVPKPRPEAYARVLERTGADARRALMIEDTLVNLVEPRRLGMATVWLNHGPEVPDPDHVDIQTRDLTGCIRRLAGWDDRAVSACD